MATTAGNTNQLGVITPKTTTLSAIGGRPGTISHGPGKNKPRVHLVSSKGKIPAGVYAEAIAHKQKTKTKSPAAKATPMPTKNAGNDARTDPAVRVNQLKNPAGVAKRPAPPHQNNPALAGRFTPQGIAHAKVRDAVNNAANTNLKGAPSAVK